MAVDVDVDVDVLSPPEALPAPPKGKLYELTPEGQLNFYFHDGQARAWDSAARFTWMLAGTQGGKTSFSPLWLWREMRRKGPGDYLAVTATYPLLKLKMLPEYLKFFQHTLHLGEWHAMDRVFTMDPDACAKHFGDPAWREEPARIIFGSGINPEGLESATAKAAALDECGQDDFRLQSWEAIQRRLAIHEGRVLGGTTIYNLGWIKQHAYDPWKNGDKDHNVIQFASTVNPSFPQRDYDRAQRTLPTWKFDMFYRGILARPGGLIYEDYNDEYRNADGSGGLKVRAFPIPRTWRCSGGVDFGAVNTALVWLAREPETRIYYLYREKHGGANSSAEHVRQAKRLSRDENVTGWWGGAKSEGQQRMDWTKAGLKVQEPPIWDVQSGIDHVTGLLRERRLFVFDSCTGVREEFNTYAHVLDENGEALDAIKDKETFHRLDATRYVVAGLTAPGLRNFLTTKVIRRGWGL